MKYVFGFFMFLSLLCSNCKSTENKKETLSPVAKEESSSDNECRRTSNEQQIEKRVAKSKDALDKLKGKEELESRYDVKCTHLYSGTNSRITSRVIRSITEIENLQEYNDEIKKFIFQTDFSKQAIVIASAGRFNTGGYSILLASAILNNDTLNLTFKVKSPGPYELVTEALTYPYVVVLVEVDEATKITMEIAGRNNSDIRNLEF
ncbi:MAG: protease complex subunit PrcB family protein [Treponemataceae bacterium]